MAKRRTITGACITWREVLGFLDTLRPWQELSGYVTSRCGPLSDATRRLMVVAVGHCVHNYDFPRNLRRLLRMIDAGDATHFRWHGHVSPKRWNGINTIIVAVQGWLQEKSPVTLSREFGVKQQDLKVLMSCLGREHSHIKRATAVEPHR